VYRHFLRSLVAMLLLTGAAVAQPPTHRMEATDFQTVNATITYEMKTTSCAVSKWMVFLPEAPELPSQGKVKSTTIPTGRILADKSSLGRKVRYIEVPVAKPTPGSGLTVRLDIEATLRSRKLVELKDGEKPPVVTPLTANERKFYLNTSSRVDHDAKAFQEWLDAKKLRRGKTEHPLDFTARVLEVLRTDFRYSYDPDEDKRASVTCKKDRADCGGMSFLLVGAMRANDIPARVLVGRLALPRKAGSNPSQTAYDRPHIRIELFVADIGWVPVDPSYANAGKSKPVRDYVGYDPGDLLVLHVEVDLRLPFPDKEREAQFLQLGPLYWTTGKGTFDGHFGPTGWELKATPIEKK
jgi:transglutaminase-like putative cysteine protease